MVTKNSIDSNIPIEVSKGGSNSSAAPTSNGVLKFDGASLVASTTLTLDSSNRLKNTSQPAFSAYLAASKLNKTGAGTVYTLGTDALTEVFDQNSDFNVNGTFTAPLAGSYYLSSMIGLTGCVSDNYCIIEIVTTKRSYFNSIRKTTGYVSWTIHNSCIADMDAGDTSTIKISSSGNATDTTDIYGSAGDFLSGFYGYLIC